MFEDLVRDIYDSASMDWATAEKVAHIMAQFLERKLPPDDFALIQRYVLASQPYTASPAHYPGYEDTLAAATQPDAPRGGVSGP